MTWGMMTGMEPLLNPARALVVTAHPDDAEFGAGGAIAHLVQGGCAVSYCVLTDGDAGGFDPTVPRSQIMKLIWGRSDWPSSRTVDTHIGRIRQKLRLESHPGLRLRPVYGVGYRLDVFP